MKATRLIAAIATMIFSTAVIAQGTNNQESIDDSGIAPQALDTALEDFAERSGLQVIYLADVAKGKTSPGSEPDLSDQATLDQLLASTDLEYEFLNDNTVTLQVSDERGASDSKNLETATPILMAQNQTSPTETTSSRSSEGGTSIVTGKVTDARTGANLKGAKVTIEETGQWTATDDLGEFRFVNVPTGSATLTVSYLGYAGQSAGVAVYGYGTSQNFELRGGSEIEEIVVFGQRSARALALNQERTAENVTTVISSDQLGQFTGTTLSESLRRAPGVTFSRAANTGDGTNISIRGLAPDFNTIKLNGVELPDGTGRGRSGSLSNILTESISKVTISKTLLPGQDSSGTGGLVEIETKTPLDRPRRFASVTLESAQRAEDFNDEFIAAGTLSGLFGNRDEFGLSASVQYRERDLTRVNYFTFLQFGQYLPLQVDGTPTITSTGGIDPRLPFPFEPGAGEVYPNFLQVNHSELSTENLGFTLSAAWELEEHSRLFLDFQRFDQTDTSFDTVFVIQSPQRYVLNQVESLGGEERQILEWSNQLSILPGYGFVPLSETLTDVLSFKGETEIGRWQSRYRLGYSDGTTNLDTRSLNVASQIVTLGTDDILPGATHPTEARVLSPFALRAPGDNSFPSLLLSSAGVDSLNSLNNFPFSQIIEQRSKGQNERLDGELAIRFQAGQDFVEYVELGFAYEDAEFSDSISAKLFNYRPVVPLSLADLGLVPSISNLTGIGVDFPLRSLSRSDVANFLTEVAPNSAADCDPFDPTSPCPPEAQLYRIENSDTPQELEEFTQEKETAAWLQGAFHFGRLEVVGGLRMTKIDISNVSFAGPIIFDENFQQDLEFFEANNKLLSQTAQQTDYLPRILANYRWSDNVVFRGGYFTSVARPQISLLSRTPQIILAQAPRFGPNGDQPAIVVNKGNPDLKPAQTHNFDLSAEFYDETLGVIKVGAFYKRIDNLLESNISSAPGNIEDVADVLPDDPRFQDVVANPNNYDVSVSIPTNNEEEATIWGIETSLEHQLDYLPGFWNGLGVLANYTYSDSSKEQPVSWFSKPVLDESGNITGFESEEFVVSDVRFNGQAKHSGTFALTYNKNYLDASLSYTRQSRKPGSFRNFNLHTFEEAFGTLDFRAEYQFEAGPGVFCIFVEGTDLLRGSNDQGIENTVGAGDGMTGKYHDRGFYFGGRQVRLGVIATF